MTGFFKLIENGARCEVGRVTVPGDERRKPREDYPGLYWHNFKWQPDPAPDDRNRGYYTMKF
ncbi:hypothetical protein NIES2101_28930 [Calothrix sp. HK-06]|nr:hypothetical protein NIES2101_28930 [Calothrix sp. HK-06]